MGLRQGASYFLAFAKRRPIISFFAVIWLLLLAGNLAKIVFPLGPSIPGRTAEQSTPATPSTPQKVVANSGWDGSVWQVERYLERNLKDPDSFEAIDWFPVVEGDRGFLVRCRYRAKNSFGGFVIEDRLFQLDEAGNVIASADFNPVGN